jgi:hypothetical protein
MRTLLTLPLLAFFVSIFPAVAAEPATDWSSKEIARFPAAEANQGVAVDAEFFYAINNKQIGKYRKSDGKRVAGWKDETGDFIHLNAGAVQNGKLFGFHSNFPSVPMFSSVETFDTESMKHTDTHSFGLLLGSLTWIAEKDGKRYACFADYSGKSGNPGQGSAYTQIVCYDEQWRRTGGYGFSKELIAKFGSSSSSGGAFGPGGFLYITGHDAKELYVLDFPAAGSIFRWIATVPVALEGQSFNWDPVKPNVLYGITRKTKEVIVMEIIPGSGFPKK